MTLKVMYLRQNLLEILFPLSEKCFISTMSVGWAAALVRCLKRTSEESPGSMEKRCRVTPGGGDPRESATESKPPIFIGKGERVG